MFSWVKMVGLYPVVSDIRMHSIVVSTYMPEWLIFSAPNGLWVFSFGAMMASLWAGTGFSIAIAWTLALWIVGIGSEVMQLYKIMPGTFDIGDIVAYTMGLVGILLFLDGGARCE